MYVGGIYIDKLYMLVVVAIVISFYYISKTLQTHGPLSNKGYSQDNDSVPTMLNRIQWSNHYKGRLNMVPRYIFYAI